MRKPLVLGLVVATSMASVAVAWAAIPNSSTGVFTGCVSNAAANKGALRVIDAQAGAACKATEKTITWGQRPPAPKLTFSSTQTTVGFPSSSDGNSFDAIRIPAGKYLVTWHATLVDFGPSGAHDFFRCEAIAYNGYNAHVAPAAAELNSAPGQGVKTIGNQAVINTPAAANVAVSCHHDNHLPDGNYYVDPGASLSAMPVS